jgi:epoxyqueuosine reductase
VTGTYNNTKNSLAPEERVKALARSVGFDDVRITTPDAPGHREQMAAWLDAQMHGEMAYLKNRAELRAGSLDNANLLDGTRSVLMLALSYDLPLPAREADDKATNGPRGTVARYARGTDYHPLMWEKLKRLAALLEAEWPGTRSRGFADSGPIRERELAARAGLGWQGRHTNLISLELGNFFFLGALLTTLALRPDAPVSGHCGTCTRCLSACPTGALVAPLTLDARRCISYLTIELRGPIPRELRPLMGDRIFGCDDCLGVCPWNERARLGQEARFAAQTFDHAHPDLLHWLEVLNTEEGFQARFKGTPLSRPKREGLRRNVCVALGNVGGSESVAPLARALATDMSPIVRGTAAWALGQIARRLPEGSDKENARTALRQAKANETDTGVGEEVSAATCG